MKNSKFISLLLALTMILSSLSGLAAITASANEAPVLSDWSFTEYYSTDFDYADQSDASVINADADSAWTWSDPVGFTLARGYKIYKKTFSMKWTRWTQYNIPDGSTADTIAFNYTLQTKGKDQYVSVIDSDNAAVQVLDQSAAADEAKTITTVIDTKTKKIYTFMPEGAVAENSYTGDTVKAIRFGNTSNESDFAFLISDFAYITEETASEATDAPTLEPTQAPEISIGDFDITEYYSTDFDYADQSDASVINADADNAWTWSDPVGFTLARGYKIYKKTFSMKWTRWTQYNVPDGSATDVIGFRYTIQTKGTEQYISVVDSDNAAVRILNQSAAADEAKTFTTVIDTKTKKIYTFMPEGAVAEDSYTGDTVKAIRFGNTSNESDFVFLISGFAYLAEEKQAVPTEEPTAEPTDEPTEEPTAEPTNEPTAVPTPDPTADPTAVPTPDPTADPTAVPTPDPTVAPTAVPTPDPTADPTAVPTPDPTAAPTAVPTPDPTAAPTAVPTPDPTADPTAVPMPDLTAEPTAAPTAEPTIKPANSADEGLGFWNLSSPTYDVENNKADMKAATAAKHGEWTGQRAFNALLAQSGDDYLGFAWNRWLQYNAAPESGTYYYKYTIEMSSNQLARLVDTTVDGTASSLSDNYPLVTSEEVSEKATFTTVVDADNKVAYTYNALGALVRKVSFTGSTLKGIQFASVDNQAANIFRIYEFKYGAAADTAKTPEPTEEPTAEPTAEPTIKPASSADEGLGFWNIANPTYDVENDKTDIKAASDAKYGDWTGQRAFSALLAQSGDDYLGFAWNRWLQYNAAPESGTYYYKYTIEMSSNQLARLVDTDAAGGASSLSDNYPLVTSEEVSEKATFTTVVDADNKVAYTYNALGELVSKVSFAGSALKGIQFASVDNDKNNIFRLYAFDYGIASDPTRPTPTPAPTEAPTPEPTDEPAGMDSKLTDWNLEEAISSEAFDGKSITALQENDWKFGNTNAGANFNEKHVIINGSGELEINWYGTATYGLTDENESYYYTYTVKTKDTSGIRSVNLSGVDNSTMLVSGKDITSSEKTFTTIVDVNSKKAYTYDNSTGDFVSAVDVSDISSVKGITFSGGLVNTNVGMQVDDVSYGLVNITAAAPDTIIVTSDDVNDGKALETTGDYSVSAEKFTDTVITFNEPVSKLEDGKVPLYITTTLEIKPAEGSFPGEIKIDGLTLTASEGLKEGTYPISVAAKATFKGETLLTGSYTVNLVKEKVTDRDIIDDYEPVITTKDSDGNEETVKDGDAVDSDLTLTTKTSFANISWKAYNSGTTDESSIISSNGAVTRPLDDTQVILVATITDPSDPARVIDTKEITLTVKGVGDMLNDAIAKAKAAIVSADTNEAVTLTDLHEDIKLYTVYDYDEYAEYKNVAFTWTSDSDVLRVSGSAAEIYPTDTKAFNVNLTVKASALGAELSEVIPVTVLLTKANAGDKYAVRCDDLLASNFEDVSVHSGTTVSDDIDVPTEGLFGSLISWTSSVPMYMSNTGEYTAPSSDTKVSMTGIVSKGKVISTNKHTYSFNVKGKKKESRSGGGSGGSSSGSSYTMPALPGVYTPVTGTASSNNGSTDTAAKGFKDLGNVPWAADAINALSDKGIVSGRDANTFDPDANITRAEFATIIVKAFGISYTGAAVEEFADVNEGDWYYSFVAAAYHSGIINGYDNGSFGAYDNITRQDMAVIIYRAARAAGKTLDDINGEKAFDDAASVSAYAKDAVDALVKAGVINGISDKEFAPIQNATRAQAAKMTYELVK